MTANAAVDEAPRVTQVALCTADVPASLRLYTEGLGFVNGGASALWGELMELQGLDADARCQMWWLVGRQEYFQLELFSHTSPAQRPLPDDWRACDVGWVRFGVAVSDFESVLARLSTCGVREIIGLIGAPGERRACFRDPFAGCFVELLEDGPHLPGGPIERHFDADPAVVYATTSVSDLDAACAFYGGTLGLAEEPLSALHDTEHERLWGLKGARRDGGIFRVGSFAIEVVRYHEPAGQLPRDDQRSSDQGLMNIALGWRQWSAMKAMVDRFERDGVTMTSTVEHPPVGVTYVVESERRLELLALPAELDAVAGFAPSHPLIANEPPHAPDGH